MVQFNVDEEKKEKRRFLCYELCASNQRQILDACKEKNLLVKAKVVVAQGVWSARE